MLYVILRKAKKLCPMLNNMQFHLKKTHTNSTHRKLIEQFLSKQDDETTNVMVIATMLAAMPMESVLARHGVNVVYYIGYWFWHLHQRILELFMFFGVVVGIVVGGVWITAHHWHHINIKILVSMKYGIARRKVKKIFHGKWKWRNYAVIQ